MMRMKDQAQLWKDMKWTNLIAFSLLYNTVYVGRFNLNHILEQISFDLNTLPYQNTLLHTSVFFAYAAGCVINGRLSDFHSPRKMILLGTGISILANIFVPAMGTWQPILLLWIVNGYFQSMIWIGGIKLISLWWPSRERGMAGGIANFFSGLSHVTAYLLPAIVTLYLPSMGWRGNFVAPMAVMAVFLFLFFLISKDRPEQVGLQPYEEDDPDVRAQEKLLEEMYHDSPKRSWNYFFRKKNTAWWCLIALLSSLCRYGLLTWIPLYYAKAGEEPILSGNFSNLILPLGMALGTLIITWFTGSRFRRDKGMMVIACSALCGAMVVIFPSVHSLEVVLIGIFWTGFFLYGVNGVLWIHSMDEGGRVYAGTIAGILNGSAYLGAALESFVFPLLLAKFGNMISVFIAIESFCIGMVICGIVISDKNKNMEKDDD